ncbi:hypothetical protein F4604DRAFT_1933770 [Suillus subluteus]|nr:hypothetical protein F4604DRAFT_1933770 [Suillus subluteus]
MARKKKDAGITIPEITWTNDLIWKLLAEIELPENRVVLLGKQKKRENTSGDSKATVYQRTAAVIFPQFHNLNPTVTGDRVKRKYKHLTKKYKELATRLRTTGEGVNDDANSNESDNEYFNCYVPVRGPDDTTTLRARSIWDEIEKVKKTVHFQAPSDDKGDTGIEITLDQQTQMQSIHHALQVEATRRANSPSFESSFDIFSHDPSSQPLCHDEDDKENAPPPSSQPISTPVAKRPPKASSFSQSSIERAKQHISKVPKKCSLDETLIDMQT